MSLTQERINEIANECWGEWQTKPMSIEDLFNLFLSRIREEQEVYGWHLTSHAMTNFTRHKQTADKYENIPLFTISPPAPECDCKELMEALKEILEHIPDVLTEEEFRLKLIRNAANEAITKHKASMGEK